MAVGTGGLARFVHAVAFESTLSPTSRRSDYPTLFLARRWLAEAYPERRCGCGCSTSRLCSAPFGLCSMSCQGVVGISVASGYGELVAERGLAHVDRHFQQQVVALTFEKRCGWTCSTTYRWP
jgi:hypothetical protein